MATPHHGSREQSELIKRFQEQQSREYARKFPDGRINENDDGELTYAVAADPKRQLVLIQFAHPTDWVGLGPDDAQKLIDSLQAKLFELRGITA